VSGPSKINADLMALLILVISQKLALVVCIIRVVSVTHIKQAIVVIALKKMLVIMPRTASKTVVHSDLMDFAHAMSPIVVLNA